MKFFVKFTKLPFVYSTIIAANKPHAARLVAEWRNDAVIYGKGELVFDFESAANFANNWICKSYTDICNTEINVKLIDETKREVYVKCREVDFEKKMRETFGKNGFLITIGGKECFAKKKGQEAVPLFYVQRNVKMPLQEEIKMLVAPEIK